MADHPSIRGLSVTKMCQKQNSKEDKELSFGQDLVSIDLQQGVLPGADIESTMREIRGCLDNNLPTLQCIAPTKSVKCTTYKKYTKNETSKTQN